jgi:hypothetical protein
MPDLEYSHKVHRQNLQTIWHSRYWHECRAIFLTFHTDNKCERCGRVGTIVPGHSSEDYLDMPSYILKVRENRVKALCPACNRNEAKGKKPCPICVALGKIDMWYIPQHLEHCPDCRSEEEKQTSEQNQQEFRKFVRKVQDDQNKKRRKFYRMVKKSGRED